MTIWKSPSRCFDRTDHNFRGAGILKTAPPAIRPAPRKILSMVCRRDVILYLAAAKSLNRRLSRGRFVLIDDGRLMAEACAAAAFGLAASRRRCACKLGVA